ncbi:MAG: DUF1207 domain-containing protein [Myxococcaceae bacterium]|nr:DUF1207 domain-containing protein [Myxococcaceae bacterium]
MRASFSLAVLWCAVAWAGAPAPARSFNVLQERTLFEPPLAHPRSPELALEVILNGPSDRVTGVIGARIPFFNFHLGEVHLQIGFDAGSWTDLRMLSHVFGFPLTAVDYLFGVPFMVAWGPFSASFELSHISAHLGDGLAMPRAPLKYTREYARLLAAYSVRGGPFVMRFYAGAQFLLHTIPTLPPWGAEVGAEVRAETSRAVEPYAAVTGLYHQDTGTFDVSSQVGVYLVRESARAFTLRLAFSAYAGSDRRGQFLGESMQRVRFGLYGRF